ncbi:uncharacterized protein LOC125799316 [Astyanax mexicanus]|uniref:uncharacterized protein LOC125799316 n=1 Tax=Astyanax mexicanus TaxID=7994 RepID=UPI0020CAEA3A|nr:uncharacterized protein LOC125799316 [Astyanax mexicanus]
MKALTGGWLLYKAPGGNGRRKLGVVPPDSEGYTASLIRMVTSSGKTALYIVPLQDELSLDPLPFCAEEFEKMPKAECRQCKSTMPLQVLYLHVKSCGGAVSTDDEEMNSVIYDDEDATIVSEGNIGSSSSKIREDDAQCPICSKTFPQDQLLVHASLCGDSLDFLTDDTTYCTADNEAENPITCEDDVLRLLASKVDGSKEFSICVSRTDFFQRAMVQWQRQKKGSPANRLKVSFIGEAGVDTGAIRKEFLTNLVTGIEEQLFEHRGGRNGKSPVYSMNDMDKGFFRVAGEVFSVSLAQGGPSPCFLRKWCYDVISTGELDESKLSKDDVDDPELYNLIKQVEEASDLSPWSNTIIDCGFTGAITKENRDAITRSIVLHATLRLMPMLKQVRKGLQTYNFVEVLEAHAELCQRFFVPGFTDDEKTDADFIIQNILPEMSEKGTIREARESALINFFQDFLQEIETAGDVHEEQPEADLSPVTVPFVMQWLTGQAHKPLLASELHDFKITLKFDHECTQRMPEHKICFPVVSACAKTITFPTVHMTSYDTFKTIMVQAIQADHGFHRV